MRISLRVPKTHANGAAEALPGQMAGSLVRRTPPEQRSDDPEIADGVEPKWRGNSQSSSNHAAKGRTDCSADIDADAVGRHRRMQVLLGNELRHDRLPGRRRQRAAGTDEKREQQQVAWRYHVEPDQPGQYRRCCRSRTLCEDEKSPFVEDVCTRARR